nr:ISL3 family transposase [Massilimicrobiota timonensis]
MCDVYCIDCGHKMRVKDVYTRKIKHSILQDNSHLILEYKQRSWVCPVCKKRHTPHVKFVSRYKQISNVTTYLAVNKLSDLTLSVSAVADDFGISDTSLHNFFLQHVSMNRLPFPEIISIDEVFTNFRDDCKYSLVIMDFTTHDIIDFLPSRREEYTNSYFISIPIEERNNVKYIISDMYEPYLNYMNRYFPNAETSIDSFHVISWLINRIQSYIRKLIRKYENDRKSDEYYLLKHKDWIILKNDDHIIEIDNPKKMDKHFNCYMSTDSYRRRFYAIDSNLKTIHDLKEKYISFNNENHTSEDAIEEKLDSLIDEYINSGIDIFIEFAKLLKDKKREIIHSFVMMPSLDKTVRLSNGAMESFNRKPKDLKRLARGIENFEFFKQRVLFSERSSKVILAQPKTFKEIQNKTDKKRGKYKKHK